MAVLVASKKHNGIAMITALLIVAIAVTIVTTIMVQQRYNIRLTGNFQDLEQAYHYAYAAEDLAEVWLERDFRENKHDSLHDFWAQKDLPPFEIDDDYGRQIGVVSMHIEDMQGRFNLNNLVMADGKPELVLIRAFQTLLQQQSLPTSFSHSVVDWIDPDDEVYHRGAEASFYLALAEPYQPTNRLLEGTEDLYLLKLETNSGKASEELLKSLLGFVTALPTPTTVNVNTASQEVLLSTGMLPRQAQMIINLRDSQPISDMAMLNEATNNTLGLDAKNRRLLGFSSDYFRLSGQVALGRSRIFLNSLLFRSNTGEVEVLRRQFSRVPEVNKLQSSGLPFDFVQGAVGWYLALAERSRSQLIKQQGLV